MESADESPDGWPFQLHIASNCTSPSRGGISAVSNSSGNPFCLFYSPTNNSFRNNVIQSSRASNSWIASLRSHSSLISTLDSRQHHYELSKRDCSGRIHGSDTIHGRSFSIDGRLPHSSPSLPSTSFRRHWGSLESIHRNQRLKQLAAQSTSKVRSLSARESTAAAERWRYIQTVLERRRKQSFEHRERFIRRPLDDILRQKAIGQSVQPAAASWDSTASGRSILKRRTANWRMRANRHVRFHAIQPDEMEDCHDDDDDDDDDDARQRAKLPIIAIPEETEAPENGSPAANEMDLRLPPLDMLSPGTGIIAEGGGAADDNTSQPLSPVGPSWVERQVAKVRQRKLWALRQQQQQQRKQQEQQEQQEQQHQMDHRPPRAVLKRSVSLVVNVPGDESDRDSLDEEEDDQSQIELDEIARHPSLVWQVTLDKDELLHPADEQRRDEPSIGYAGWPNFPATLAVGIQQRQHRLKKRKVNRKEKNVNCCNEAGRTGNSFVRRKCFGKRLSIALIRQRKAKRNEAPCLANGQRPAADRPAIDGQEKKTNAEEKTDPVDIVDLNPIAVDSGLISLQVVERPDETAGHLSSIHADVVDIVAPDAGSNGAHAAHPSDAINEEDVTQAVTESTSASQATIEADVHYRPEGSNPVADWLAASATEAADKRRETAASAFRPSSVCGRQEEITDESTSDVTVDDGRHLTIDQSNDTSDVTAARASQKNEAGMACGPRSAIPPDRPAVDQIEYRIASALQDCCDGDANKDGPVRRRRPAYCCAWPLLFSNEKSDAIPPAVATVSYWNDFQDPTSEKAIVHPAAASANFHLTPENDPADTPAMMKNGLDKKTKDAHNVSRLWPPSRASVPTQTDAPSIDDHQEFGSPEADKQSDPIDDDVEDAGEAANECQCLHRAVLTCLLPEAAETLANLEQIRRQLKRARIRRRENEPQRQPLQARRDVFSGIDPAERPLN